MGFFDMFTKTSSDKIADAFQDVFPYLGNNKEIIEDMQRNMIQGKKLWEKGRESVDCENYKQAINYFSQSISYNDTASGPFLDRGYAYQMIGDTNNAIQDYIKTINLEENDPSNTNNLETAQSNLQMLL